MDVLSIFAKIVVHRHFHIFNMASKMATNGHVTIFIIIASNVVVVFFFFK